MEGSIIINRGFPFSFDIVRLVAVTSNTEVSLLHFFTTENTEITELEFQFNMFRVFPIEKILIFFFDFFYIYSFPWLNYHLRKLIYLSRNSHILSVQKKTSKKNSKKFGESEKKPLPLHPQMRKTATLKTSASSFKTVENDQIFNPKLTIKIWLESEKLLNFATAFDTNNQTRQNKIRTLTN